MGNKYRLGRKIGSGSFGDIYLGESKSYGHSLLLFDGSSSNDYCLLLEISCHVQQHTNSSDWLPILVTGCIFFVHHCYIYANICAHYLSYTIKAVGREHTPMIMLIYL